jgi:putative phosphoribosyl transferase
MVFNPDATSHEVRIDPPGLSGFFETPPDAKGVVVFAHGSGSGRLSPRSNYVAGKLREASIATLLLDLLTPEEEHDHRNVFDIELLATRLLQATAWVEDQPAARGLPVGYFGASTGTGAALLASARNRDIAAVVSRGGRPDLAMNVLGEVRAPTLLIVGGRDGLVIDLNRAAKARLGTEAELIIVPGAGHLFEEPGTLDEVIAHARGWFLSHFVGAAGWRASHDRPQTDLH